MFKQFKNSGGGQLGRAGMVVTNDGTKTTFLGKAGDYNRIGDAGVTSHTLNSEDDLLVTGDLEVNANLYADDNLFVSMDNKGLIQGGGNDIYRRWQTGDADAHCVIEMVNTGGGVPVWVYGDLSIDALDFGLFDGLAQPTLAMIEKDAKYTSSSTGTHDGTDTDELTETGKFTNSVVGDILRITSGTNVTTGFYFIHDVTDNDNVNLDRAFVTGGAASNVVYVAYHKLSIYGADGITIPIKNSDFSASDFEFLGGVRFGWRDDLNELQIVKMDGTMKSIVLI